MRPAFRRITRCAAAMLFTGALASTPARAQWVTTFETFYLQAPHNWVFRDNYQSADRLFNAFDYGHAILYETLYRKPDAPASELEERIYDKLTKQVLVKPPRVPLEEVAIEPMYARLAPEAKAMFDWSHILHRQIYDVLADERLTQEAKDREVQRLIAYYKTRKDLAFSSRPKSMELMQEQPYSLAFRQKYPKFNGLIWGYHWLQVGLYEPLVTATTAAGRQEGVRATVTRFWQMLQDPPNTLPYQMPMTAAISPEFARRYPEAAIIFDNLHSMHDVVSDILANPSVPRDSKRAEIVRAGRLFRDDTSYVMPVEGWRVMSREMGVENMGGPAVGFGTPLPTPTVTRGAVMQHDRQTGSMTGMKVGAMTGGAHAGMNHGATTDTASKPATSPTAAAAPTGHEGHDMSKPMPAATPAAATAPPASATPAPAAHDAMHDQHHPAESGSAARELHRRLLADPVIRRRIVADTALRRLVLDQASTLPAAERAEIERLLARPTGARAPARRPPAAAPPAHKH
ncbi:MAG TPA: hypothetical protein VE861_08695 [Gemmatimonadaceae bacterium]|nr:hypothetical protein [Gemmatimonadaceae bacterium]